MLGIQHHLGMFTISLIMIAANVGALPSGVAFGALSDRIGSTRAILATVLLTLTVLPAWVGAASALHLDATATLLLFCVQGAWGVVPIYLNELSLPPTPRSGCGSQAGWMATMA